MAGLNLNTFARDIIKVLSSTYVIAKHGIDVMTEVIDPLAEKNAAMLRGDLDGMGGTIDSAVISAASGVDGVIVFMFDRSNGTDGILVTEEVQSVQGLQGKRVALEEGFVGHFFLLYVLEFTIGAHPLGHIATFGRRDGNLRSRDAARRAVGPPAGRARSHHSPARLWLAARAFGACPWVTARQARAGERSTRGSGT